MALGALIIKERVDIPAKKKWHKSVRNFTSNTSSADNLVPVEGSQLNEAREKMEAMIDALYEPFKEQMVKSRTYRRKARKDYLNLAKSKRPRPTVIRRAIGKQLRYVKRDLKTINWLLAKNQNGLTV